MSGNSGKTSPGGRRLRWVKVVMQRILEVTVYPALFSEYGILLYQSGQGEESKGPLGSSAPGVV